MQNKYKLPPDVRRASIGIVQGQMRRIQNSRHDNSNNNESMLIEIVNNALDSVCFDIEAPKLKADLQDALIQNCICKQNVFEHYDLPGISRKSFYKRKNKLLYLVAKEINIL